jgi:para-nitrobenzyl esterase
MRQAQPSHVPHSGSFAPPGARFRGVLASTFLAAASLLGSGAVHAARAQGCVTLPGGAQVCGAADTVTIAGSAVVVPTYRGIRYAQAPTGALRWQAPQPFTLSGTVNAASFGATCPQGDPDKTARNPPPPPRPPVQPQAEDCLFLNVWTPRGTTATSALPVMVFIHGGAFVEGSGSSPLYRGGYLVQTGNVILVTINYRLGALGFLRAVAGGDTVSGNFGLMDQQAALRWVQANIAAFGGDPARVTLFGESAGAMSAGFHLLDVPTSVPLFRAAIMESNPMGVEYRTSAEAASDGASFVATLCSVMHRKSCTPSLAWLQDSVPADSVLVAEARYEGLPALHRLHQGGLPEGLPWTPAVDGAFVTGQPYRGYAAGMHPKPYVFGMNRDEGVVFAGGAEHTAGILLNAVEYGRILNDVFGKANADTITAFPRRLDLHRPYAATLHTQQKPLDATASAFSQLMNDAFFDCANLASAVAGAATNADSSTASAPLAVYGYLFVRSPIPFNLYGSLDDCTPATGWVCHADELPYVFNSLAYANPLYGNKVAVQTADTAVANGMQRAWTAFATNPYAAPAAGWTAYTAASPGLYAWGSTGSPMLSTLPSTANCSLWQRVPPLGAGYSAAPAARRQARRTVRH